MNFMHDVIESGSIKEFVRWAQHNSELCDIVVTGSRVICDPPVLDTDDDRLVLVWDLDKCGAWFSCHGWDNCLADWKDKEQKDGGEPESEYNIELACGARFQAWRRGDVNVIITDDMTLHLRSRAATLLAKELNLQEKEQRIALFCAIKFGEAYNGRLA